MFVVVREELLVPLEEESPLRDSHLELTCATCETVAETVGRLKNTPAPRLTAERRREIPRRSSGWKAAETVREMEEMADWKGRAEIWESGLFFNY